MDIRSEPPKPVLCRVREWAETKNDANQPRARAVPIGDSLAEHNLIIFPVA
jgi:hypothetical protein